MTNKKLLLTLGFFLLAMILGWLLRLQFVYPTGIVAYKHLLHAHSHVILLGWAFNALYISINAIYYPQPSHKKKKLGVLFWSIQATILLAMFGFLREGYALFSIFFSTAFLVGAFIWIAWIWKDIKKDKSIGGRFILLSLLLFLFSSLGPLSLGAIMSTPLKETNAYPLSIYFYLHFLYNGFFVFGLIGICFRYLDDKKIEYKKKYAEYFYKAMKWSIVPLYALSAVWVNEGIWVNLLGGLAAAIQIWGGFYLFKMIRGMQSSHKLGLPKMVNLVQKLLLTIVLFVFGLKLILQFLSSIQWVSDVSFAAKSFLIIGYIHLVMLGLISLAILLYFIVKKWLIVEHRLSRIGLYLFLAGIVFSEGLLFGQGFLSVFMLGQIPAYFMLLLIVSGLMPLGILLMMIRGRLIFIEE